MTSYCDIKDAYSNNDELDKLARDFNNNKKQMVKQVRQDNKKDKHIYSNNFYHGVFGVNPAVDEFCTKKGYELKITKEWFGTWIVKK